jgi:hypothetical protein
MNEIMRNCMEWMVSLGWVGLLLAVLVAAVVGGGWGVGQANPPRSSPAMTLAIEESP